MRNRCQRNAAGVGELNVVIADHRQLLGYSDAVLKKRVHQAEGEKVIGAEHAGWPATLRKPEEAFTGALTLDNCGCRRLQVQQATIAEPRLSDGLLRPGVAMGHLRHSGGTAHERQLGVPNSKR